MANTDFKSIDEYIVSRPKDVQRLLRRVRTVIGKTLPGAEEAISYQIPAFKMNGRVVIFFAGWKNHYSLYPATAHVVATLKKELAPYEIAKGTIRFPYAESMPVHLIARIAKLRAKEVAARKTTKKKKTPANALRGPRRGKKRRR